VPAGHEPAGASQGPVDQLARPQPVRRQAPSRPPAPSRPQAPAGRRHRAAAALVSALGLIAVGSVAFVLSRQSAPPAAHHGQAAGAEAPGAATRNLAAAWVAAQVSQAAIVSCDQAMCRALAARGMPAGDLLELRQGAADPRRSAVIVATAEVRGLLGSRLRLVYAPEVIASFGSGNQRIDIREIAPQGATEYAAAVGADLAARRASGAELLRSQRILVSAAARRQLKAGQVDSRLLIAIAGMAAMHPVRIVAFGDAGPVAGPGSPLRSADLTAAGAAASPGGSSGYMRSMLAFLRAQRAPYLPAHAGAVRLADGQAVLRIEFAAPSPLGLLNPRVP